MLEYAKPLRFVKRHCIPCGIGLVVANHEDWLVFGWASNIQLKSSRSCSLFAWCTVLSTLARGLPNEVSLCSIFHT